MAQGAISYIGYAQLFGSVNQPVCFMQRLEGRIFCLNGIDLGD